MNKQINSDHQRNYPQTTSKNRSQVDTIGNVFFRLGLIERYGTGVQRIKEEYKDYYNKPIFKISDNFIKIVLPLIEKDDNYSEKEKNIINSLKNSKLSSSEITDLTGIKKTTLVELLNSMTEKGYIAADGNGKNRRYYLTL